MNIHSGPMAGRTVLVTGGTGGIGRTTAVGLARLDAFGAEDPAGVQRLLVPFLRPFMRSADEGAATSIQVASASDLERTNGQYFANSKPKRSSARSYDEVAAARLWHVSADLVGLSTTPPPDAVANADKGG
jgi:hypothetical protein